MFFPESLFTTHTENNHWERFWQDQGIGLGAIYFEKKLGTPNSFKEFRDNNFDPQMSILGLVVDSIDSIMHGIELGMTGMYNQVKIWYDEGFLGNLIHFLHEKDFVVFLTSDHGNIEAIGTGSPGEGSIANVRGERVRIYADGGLRDKVHEKHGNSFVWTGFGLPADCFPLLAEGNKSFSPAGKKIVTHGGASLEEVIVPFVEISRN